VSILINSEYPLELADSIGLGMKSTDVCGNTIFHSAVKAENVEFLDTLYFFLLPFNLFGTSQYSVGFHHFSDQILLQRNFSKKTVYDLLKKLRNSSKFESLSNSLTSLSQLLCNLNYIHEVRTYFSDDKPRKDIRKSIYLEMMAKISVSNKTAVNNEMKQMIGQTHYAKLTSDRYLAYVIRGAYRKTATCILNLYNVDKKLEICNADICGMFWNVDENRDDRRNAFLKWDAKVQEAAYCR